MREVLTVSFHNMEYKSRWEDEEIYLDPMFHVGRVCKAKDECMWLSLNPGPTTWAALGDDVQESVKTGEHICAVSFLWSSWCYSYCKKTPPHPPRNPKVLQSYPGNIWILCA